MEIYINHKLVPIDTAAIIKNGRAYMPLRAVMEAYGYTVDWDSKGWYQLPVTIRKCKNC